MFVKRPKLVCKFPSGSISFGKTLFEITVNMILSFRLLSLAMALGPDYFGKHVPGKVNMVTLPIGPPKGIEVRDFIQKYYLFSIFG